MLGQEPHRTLLKEIFNVLIQRLGSAVTDLGRDTAGDTTALSARRKSAKGGPEEIDEGLPQASGGRKEYKGDQGHVTKVVEWFGYKLHLLVDVKHEVVLAYEITDTKAGDGETLPVVLEQAQANLPEDRIKTLAYDKAADSEDVRRAALRRGDHAGDPDAQPVAERVGADAAGPRWLLERRVHGGWDNLLL